MVFVCTVIIHVDSRLNDRSDAPIDLVRFYSDEFSHFTSANNSLKREREIHYGD